MVQDALNQLRVSSSGIGAGRTSESIETLQSRAREFEKKVCAFTLKHFVLECLGDLFFYVSFES